MHFVEMQFSSNSYQAMYILYTKIQLYIFQLEGLRFSMHIDSTVHFDKLTNFVIVDELGFYGPSTHFRSFRARSINQATLFLGKPPPVLTNYKIMVLIT